MKIKAFDEKVRIGTQVVYKGKVFTVADINRNSHEAVFGRNTEWIRCSEFEMYMGGKVPEYVEDIEARDVQKKGRKPRPVTAIFKNGKKKVFRSSAEASETLGLSLYHIRKVLYRKAHDVKGIRFTLKNTSKNERF